MQSPVAVIGNSGLNIGFAVAADLSLAGHEVRLAHWPDRTGALDPVRARDGFEVQGDPAQLVSGKLGHARPVMIRTEIGAALRGADVVFLDVEPAELEARFAALLPEVLLGVDAARFAEVAAAVFAPAPPPPTVSLAHLHAPRVSIAEQAEVVAGRLRAAGDWVGFTALVADCDGPGLVVARFLALLELYRRAAVTFDQPDPLGELRVRWAAEQVIAAVSDEEWR